jgi:regulator of replication initiation timing
MDFEQQIVRCWGLVDDLKELSAHIVEHDLVGTDTVHNHIFGLACVYDVKFHNLWEMFENVHMSLVRENKMLELECKALRQQLLESDPDTAGYGIAAIKPNKKDKK